MFKCKKLTILIFFLMLMIGSNQVFASGKWSTSDVYTVERTDNGDNITYTTTTFADAMAQCPGQSKTIYLPPGETLITTTQDLKNTVIKGQGVGVSIIRMQSATNNAFSVTASNTYAGLEKLTITRGPSSTVSYSLAATQGNGIDLNAQCHIMIDNVEFKYHNSGICNNSTSTDQCYDVNIVNSVFKSNKLNHIKLKNFVFSNIRSCLFSNSYGDALVLEKSNNININNISVTGSNGVGIYLEGNASEINNKIMINNSFVENSKGNHIHCKYGLNLLISSCSFTKNGVNLTTPINLSNAWTWNPNQTILTDAIRLEKVESCDFIDNQVKLSAKEGILVLAGNNINIKNNQIFNSGRALVEPANSYDGAGVRLRSDFDGINYGTFLNLQICHNRITNIGATRHLDGIISEGTHSALMIYGNNTNDPYDSSQRIHRHSTGNDLINNSNIN